MIDLLLLAHALALLSLTGLFVLDLRRRRP
jgi:hypothetical protein